MYLSSNFFNKQKTGDLMAYATNEKRIHKKFNKVQKTFSNLSGIVQESISGIRVVKAFVQEEKELEKVSSSAYDYVKENIDLVKINAIFHPSFMLIIGFSMLIVLVYGGEATIVGKITMGQFIAFFQYLGMFIWPMIAIGWVVNLYQRGTVSLKRLNKIFAIKSEINDDNADFSLTKINGKINIKNLKFKYKEDSPNIFNGINLEIKENETLAIVGKTGCGKSTIIDLLTRVYNPPKNSIFLDDKDIYDFPLQILRENLVMVPQDIFLFSDTIAGNISLGYPNADRKLIEDVAKKAEVYEDIMEFENGFDTIIGERGVTLSGGQKQRIAIARAFLKNPKILILDDSLSAIDTKTETRILKNLIDLRENKTTIIIAHRISSIQHANNIIVIGDGKIIEKGNHTDLLELNGIYRDLFEKQQIEEKIKEI